MNKPLLLTSSCVLLAFIVIGLFGLPQNSLNRPEDALQSPLQSESDYYISGMVMDSFMPDGTRNYRMTANQVTHFPDGDTSVLTMPALNWYEADQVSWVMTANSGVLQPDSDSGQDRLLLEDNVVANKASPDGRVLNITTTTLTVLPAIREATTQAPVVFQRENMHLTGVGMHAWLAQDRIKLLSQVKGRYE